MLGVGILVDVIVETDLHAEMIYFGVTFSANNAVYNADNAELLNALLPVEADFADLTWLSAFRHRQRAPREYIVRWDRFLDDIG